MASTRVFAVSLGGRSALLPMDAAMEYLRERLWRVLPAYLVAMTPYSLAVLMLIDAVSSEHRSAIAPACTLLVAATIWRWLWQAQVQRRVQEDVFGQPPMPMRRRWLAYLLVRCYANLAIVWGGFIILPAYYGFLIAGFAAPMLLEEPRPAWVQVKQVFIWLNQWSMRMAKVLSAFAVFFLLAFISAMALQIFFTSTVLPSLLGLDATGVSLTTGSFAWILCIIYFLFMVFDLYWTVLSVFVYYDLQSRRLGSDLRVRLQGLAEAHA